MHAAVPIVEIANHADALRVRRPDAETDAGRALDRAKMRAKLAVYVPVVALGVKMHVGLTEHAPERIRVALLPLLTRVALQAQQIRKLRGTLRQHRLEKSVGMNFRSGKDLRAVSRIDHAHRSAIRAEGAHRDAIARATHPKRLERITVPRFEKGGQFFGGYGRLHGR